MRLTHYKYYIIMFANLHISRNLIGSHHKVQILLAVDWSFTLHLCYFDSCHNLFYTILVFLAWIEFIINVGSPLFNSWFWCTVITIRILPLRASLDVNNTSLTEYRIVITLKQRIMIINYSTFIFLNLLSTDIVLRSKIFPSYTPRDYPNLTRRWTRIFDNLKIRMSAKTTLGLAGGNH